MISMVTSSVRVSDKAEDVRVSYKAENEYSDLLFREDQACE